MPLFDTVSKAELSISWINQNANVDRAIDISCIDDFVVPRKYKWKALINHILQKYTIYNPTTNVLFTTEFLYHCIKNYYTPTQKLTKNISIGFFEFNDNLKKLLLKNFLNLDKNDKDCPICLFEISNCISVTSCVHYFHSDCIKKVNFSCPICREKLVFTELK